VEVAPPLERMAPCGGRGGAPASSGRTATRVGGGKPVSSGEDGHAVAKRGAGTIRAATRLMAEEGRRADDAWADESTSRAGVRADCHNGRVGTQAGEGDDRQHVR
jgi:hypothetical protein